MKCIRCSIEGHFNIWVDNDVTPDEIEEILMNNINNIEKTDRCVIDEYDWTEIK